MCQTRAGEPWFLITALTGCFSTERGERKREKQGELARERMEAANGKNSKCLVTPVTGSDMVGWQKNGFSSELESACVFTSLHQPGPRCGNEWG